MINESAEYFESIAKQLGLTIRIPRSSRRMKKISALTNGVVGMGCLTVGVLSRKMPLAIVGVLGMAGAALLILDDAGQEEQDDEKYPHGLRKGGG